ncbi:MAG: hypothetical protein IJ593_05265 [Lachnospiraceae bacterium]|nr:hypothetical protein [Lachnospiraceae bacterium]
MLSRFSIIEVVNGKCYILLTSDEQTIDMLYDTYYSIAAQNSNNSAYIYKVDTTNLDIDAIKSGDISANDAFKDFLTVN